MTLKTTDLTVQFDTGYNCWIAFEGPTPEDSHAIGEGFTRENAIADYWYSRHDGKTAHVLEPYDNGTDKWALHDGTYVAYFDTRAEAVAEGEATQYITSPFIKEV